MRLGVRLWRKGENFWRYVCRDLAGSCCVGKFINDFSSDWNESLNRHAEGDPKYGAHDKDDCDDDDHNKFFSILVHKSLLSVI